MANQEETMATERVSTVEERARERMEFMDLPWTLGESEKQPLAEEMAAFARAEVKAALEEAAKSVEGNCPQFKCADIETVCRDCKRAAQRIRELIPKEHA